MVALIIVGGVVVFLASFCFGLCVGLYAATEEKQIKSSEALKNYYS